ncbi:TerD family protein [Aliikangiella coralliicola]|uniref:TerD family protein n=1 Tax=Aliikangiella coralliicola TaxID=2592383 RepID=A0A545TV30_9GAMM|nr:TerD family protein [Aliikangiella coralliicola]TQV81069.1 TerD family protein [Aliikangiella coralliicola]
MTLTKNRIALKKLDALVLEHDESTELNQKQRSTNKILVSTLNAEMMRLGYVMSESLFSAALQLGYERLVTLFNEVISILKNLKGDDVVYQPMYPNFPQQVIDADVLELYFNALMHYWTFGHWSPEYETLNREFQLESIKYRQIDLVTDEKVGALFTTLLKSSDSLSEEDKSIISWFIENVADEKLAYPEEIPFNENKCVVAGLLLKQGKDISPLVKTATDVLRIVTFLSEGDVSLANNTKFVSLPRSTRKKLVGALERVISEEDIGRHRRKWVKLFHNLHVGDYSNKVFKIASKARNNETLKSFYGYLEHYFETHNIEALLRILVTRPGEFGRRLDQVLRIASAEQQKQIVGAFLSVIDKIPTRNLCQLLGHMNCRNNGDGKRVVFPKGVVQKAVVIDSVNHHLAGSVKKQIIMGIQNCLVERFSRQEALGKVWIDPDLMGCPLPTQQRSASEGLFNVARGTQLPIGDKDTLRFFIYWKGQDIDLSASFHDAEFNLIEYVSYTHLRSSAFKAYHSGDITRAPKGACEFIDITLDAAVKKGARYLAMNVMVYSGPTFANHEVCYAGWMSRSAPNSNEVFDAATVEQKIDVNGNCRNVIPIMFDLVTRKAIWVDLATSRRTGWGGNNVESNAASIEEKLEAIVHSRNKLSLYELFELHVFGRGELVDSVEKADTVFSLEAGVTPFHINEINAEFLK